MASAASGAASGVGAQGAGMRFHVDGWDPSYGSAMEDTGDVVGAGAESTADIDAGVETPPQMWAPISAAARASRVTEPGAVVFVDGVRRIEARIWIPDNATASASGSAPGAGAATDASMGVAASYAAGAVCCCPKGGAHVLTAEHRRGLFSIDANALDIATRAGTFAAFHAPASLTQSPALALSAALQSQLLDLELRAAADARAAVNGHCAQPDTDLLVIDGPLRSREQLPRAIGFIKTHRAIYLEKSLNDVVARLDACERTPVFLMGTTWNRYAWYLRLPCRPGAPWTGVVRVECSPRRTASEAMELATLSQQLLPRYASVEYKDPRAPQNLVPIAGLEKQLRRRLGDQKLVYRALQVAAASSG
jgi:hypothetical protein